MVWEDYMKLKEDGLMRQYELTDFAGLDAKGIEEKVTGLVKDAPQ